MSFVGVSWQFLGCFLSLNFFRSQCWNHFERLFSLLRVQLWDILQASFIFIFWMIVTRSHSVCFGCQCDGRNISPYHSVGVFLAHCGCAVSKTYLPCVSIMCRNNHTYYTQRTGVDCIWWIKRSCHLNPMCFCRRYFLWSSDIKVAAWSLLCEAWKEKWTAVNFYMINRCTVENAARHYYPVCLLLWIKSLDTFCGFCVLFDQLAFHH